MTIQLCVSADNIRQLYIQELYYFGQIYTGDAAKRLTRYHSAPNFAKYSDLPA